MCEGGRGAGSATVVHVYNTAMISIACGVTEGSLYAFWARSARSSALAPFGHAALDLAPLGHAALDLAPSLAARSLARGEVPRPRRGPVVRDGLARRRGPSPLRAREGQWVMGYERRGAAALTSGCCPQAVGSKEYERARVRGMYRVS